MNEPVSTPAIVTHDAADALIVLGWPVHAAEDDPYLWKIGDFVLTDEELLDLAAWRETRAAVERLQ